MQPIFFLSIATQFENLGDAVINRELALLAASHGEIVIDWSRCPESFRRTLNLSGQANVRFSKNRMTFFRALFEARAKRRRCILLLNPGGYLGALGISSLKAKAILMFYRLLTLAGVEIMQFGASYERLDEKNQIFLRRKAALLRRHFVRDYVSLEYARHHDFKVDGVLPDLAFALFSEGVEIPQGKKAPLIVGLSFRSGQYPSQEYDVHNIIKNCVKALGEFPLHQFRLISQVSWDVQTMQRIEKLLLDEFGIIAKATDVHADIEMAQLAYAECDIILSNRLHALLIGATVCSSILACVEPVHNAKILGLFRWAGWEKNIALMEQTSADEMRELLESAMSSPLDGRIIAEKLREGFADAIADAR